MMSKVLMVVTKTICKQIRERRAMLMQKVIANAQTEKQKTTGPINKGMIATGCA